MIGSSPIIRVIARFAAPISLAVAMRIFLQGHDNPGGGFIAGVLVAAAGAVWLLAFGMRGVSDIAWWRVAVLGLILSVLTGTAPLLNGKAFMDHTILHIGGIHLPTATFFDLGVLLIVVGTLMTIFNELARERH
jgi:multisubunit Na+/H+ antiporter MnhB subunit